MIGELAWLAQSVWGAPLVAAVGVGLYLWMRRTDRGHATPSQTLVEQTHRSMDVALGGHGEHIPAVPAEQKQPAPAVLTPPRKTFATQPWERQFADRLDLERERERERTARREHEHS